MALVYTLTIFVSAFLLFLIQPMISKLLLPHLGGSPAVWNTAMMFFQIFLLAGYLYTHLSSKWLGTRKQSLLHIALLLVSLAWLPIALKTDINFSSSEYPISWVVTSLFLSVGMPFFLLSSNAPLLQFWMANTTHPHARNPYFLYSASNIGSLLALLGYPFLIEPALTLSSQTSTWSGLFVVYILLVATCAGLLRKHHAAPAIAAQASTHESPPPTWKMKLYWVALAFFPSSLMLGLTTYITTDIAAVPLFWVVPLALYLITFILAFSSQHNRITDFALKAQNILVPLTAFTMVFNIQSAHVNPAYITIFLHLITFFVTAMVCHGTLSRNKPSAKYLTEFYVWMSVGGMLGGVFNAMIVPNLFTTSIEYTVIFLASLVVRPVLGTYSNPRREMKLDLLIPAGFGLLLLSVLYGAGRMLSGFVTVLRGPEEVKHSLGESAVMAVSWAQFLLIIAIYVFIMVVVDKTYKRPLRLTLIVVALFLASHYSTRIGRHTSEDNLIFVNRNFFGITQVYQYSHMILMRHGTTNHGVQSTDSERKLILASYYGPMKQILKHLDPSVAHHPYAVLGLGAGTLACAGSKGQMVDFYEIDPDVVRMARDPQLFTYLRDCPTKYEIFLGDGRLELAKADDHRYSAIVMDAFTSDAVPMHLLTREALAIYKSKLADGGMIAFNISNRYLDLAPVLARLAKDAELYALSLDYIPNAPMEFASRWLVLTSDPKYFGRISKENKDWKTLQTDGSPLWTDDYSNIFQALY